MGYNFERSKKREEENSKEIKYEPQNEKVTPKEVENFDDCRLEKSTSAETGTKTEQIETSEDDFDDCRLEKGKNAEKCEENEKKEEQSEDDFDDCRLKKDEISETSWEADKKKEGKAEDKSRENIEENAQKDAEDLSDDDENGYEEHDLKEMADDEKVEVNHFNKGEILEDNAEEIESKTDVELPEKDEKEEKRELQKELEKKSKDGEIRADEAREVIDERVEEKLEMVEEAQEKVSEEIEENAEKTIKEEQNLSEAELKEKIEKDAKDNIKNDELSEDEKKAIVEEQSEEIEKTVERELEEAELKEEAQEEAKEVVEDAKESIAEAEEKTENAKEEKTVESLEKRMDKALEDEETTKEDLDKLAAEAQEVVDEMEKRQQELEKEADEKFQETCKKKSGTDEFKESLKEYNESKDKKEQAKEELKCVKEKKELVDKKAKELREEQIKNGREAAVTSVTTLEDVKALEKKYDEEYYKGKLDKKALRGIREDNENTIKKLSKDKKTLKNAMDSKMEEIAKYVNANNMGRAETAVDPYYQEMTQEYLSFKEAYERVDYSIVKLNENNNSITESLGDAHKSKREGLSYAETAEVAIDTEIPQETSALNDNDRGGAKEKNAQRKTRRPSIVSTILIAREMNDTLKADEQGFETVKFYRLNKAANFINGQLAKKAHMLPGEKVLDPNFVKSNMQVWESRYAASHPEEKIAFKEPTLSDEYIQSHTLEVEMPLPNYQVNEDIAMENERVSEQTEDQLELSKIEKEYKQELNSKFTTNDGKRIKYKNAVKQITNSAEKYMNALNVDKAVQSQVIVDMKKELYKQHIEAGKRALGDHGIRHIYGNFERGENYLKTRKGVTDEQKLAVLVSQVYHDEGYTYGENKLGTNNKNNNDKLHDYDSLKAWKEPERAKIYKEVFAEDTLKSIDVAIGQHNAEMGKQRDVDGGVEGLELVQKNTAVNADVVVSTVHICDKLALSQREKMPELLLNDPKMVELTEGVNSVFDACKKLDLCDNSMDAGKKMLDRYHQKINEHIDSMGYDKQYADQLKEAVKRDIGIKSGYFTSRMNYIYTSSDCFQYNEKTGNNEITIKMIEYQDNKSTTDLQYRQIDKMFKDLGVELSQEEIGKIIDKKDGYENGYQFEDGRGLCVKIEKITENEIREQERKRFQENNDLKEMNERIESGRGRFNEMSQKMQQSVLKKDIKDLTYKDVSALERSLGSRRCNKEMFDSYSEAEKKKLMQSIVADLLISNTEQILNR